MRYPPRALLTGINLTLQCLFDDILLADPHRLRIFTANENFSEKVTMLLTGLSTLSARKIGDAQISAVQVRFADFRRKTTRIRMIMH